MVQNVLYYAVSTEQGTIVSTEPFLAYFDPDVDAWVDTVCGRFIEYVGLSYGDEVVFSSPHKAEVLEWISDNT